MEYRDKNTSETFVPHVIEPSFGVERLVMAVLTSAYTEDEIKWLFLAYDSFGEELLPNIIILGDIFIGNFKQGAGAGWPSCSARRA